MGRACAALLPSLSRDARASPPLSFSFPIVPPACTVLPVCFVCRGRPRAPRYTLTTLVKNAAASELRDGVLGFVSSMPRECTAVVYFAGHGAVLEGEQHLLAADTRPGTGVCVWICCVRVCCMHACAVCVRVSARECVCCDGV